jgi:hydrogenase maturation protease
MAAVAVAVTSVAPLLVVAIGNASRGDDALGPTLAERLRERGVVAAGTVELLEAYQLQIEDVLALAGRRAVLFVDAARAGQGADVTLEPLAAARAAGAGRATTAFTHAMAPGALLALHEQLSGSEAPPAWLLAIEGESFALGAPLSPVARQRLQAAEVKALAWLAAGGTISPVSSPKA